MSVPNLIVRDGKRAVGLRHWRWRPGCAWIAPTEGGFAQGRVPDRDLSLYEGWEPAPGAVPNLVDNGTRGILLWLVRNAWNDQFLSVDGSEGKGFRWRGLQGRWSDYFATEVYALLDALEHAPAVQEAT